MLSDITIQGNKTISEKELISIYGNKLTKDQMKKVKIIKIIKQDIFCNNE